MVFDPDTEFMIELKATEGGVNYSQNLQYKIDLGQRSSGGSKKDYVAIGGGGGSSQNNVNSGIANFKQRNPQLTFLAYYNKVDNSNGSLQDAINNGDFNASSFDNRILTPAIESVDTTAETITINGDFTERAKSGNTIVIDGSTGNDGLYNIDSLTYDSGADETTVTVVGDLTDSTADGNVSDGVKTVVEQRVWLEEYVFDGRIGEEYFLRGQEFEDDNFGKNIVVQQAEIVRSSSSPTTGNGTIKTSEGFNIG